jgi:heme/copper-type cytochrome/quinol oxidase subunit 3
MAERALAPALPVGSVGRKGSGWWGLVCLVATEAALFAYLLFCYFYFSVQLDRAWLPDPLPEFRLALPNTIILLVSSVTMWSAEHGARTGRRARLVGGLVATIVLGIAFFVIQLFEWKAKSFALATSAYSSLYYTTTGFHMVHVAVGVLVLVAVLAWALLGYFDRRRHVPVLIAAVYWHFVDVVWLAVFFTYYVTPHLGFGR